jgi:hypothetical protein
MNKYHVAISPAYHRYTTTGEEWSLGFAGVTFSRESAELLADGMNKSPGPWGVYFVVPAPFAGEI